MVNSQDDAPCGNPLRSSSVTVTQYVNMYFVVRITLVFHLRFVEYVGSSRVRLMVLVRVTLTLMS